MKKIETLSRTRHGSIETLSHSFRNVFVSVKRLTPEDMQKYEVSISVNQTNNELACAKSNPKTQRKSKKKGGRKSMRLQLEEQMLKELPTREYLLNEVILATIPGYSPWPARILEINGQTIVVEFFGARQM